MRLLPLDNCVHLHAPDILQRSQCFGGQAGIIAAMPIQMEPESDFRSRHLAPIQRSYHIIPVRHVVRHRHCSASRVPGP